MRGFACCCGQRSASGALAACYGIAQYFGWDPLLAGTGLSSWRRRVHHCSTAGNTGTCRLFRGLAGGGGVPGDCFASHGGATAVSNRGADGGWIGGDRDCFERHAARRCWARAWAESCCCSRGAERIGMRGALRSVWLARRAWHCSSFRPAGLKLRARLHWSIEDARGGARLLLWRDSLRMSAHRPAWVWSRDVRDRVPAFRIGAAGERVSGFLSRIAAQHVPGCVDGGGCAGTDWPYWGFACWAPGARCSACRSGNVLGPPLAAAFAGLLVTQQFTAFVFTTALYFHLFIDLLVVTPCRLESGAGSYTRPLVLIPLVLAILIFAAYATRLVMADRTLAITWQQQYGTV